MKQSGAGIHNAIKPFGIMTSVATTVSFVRERSNVSASGGSCPREMP